MVPEGIVKLTKSSSIDPQDTGLEPAVNPPCWASRTAVGLNLTIPSRSSAAVGHSYNTTLATQNQSGVYSQLVDQPHGW